MDIITRAAAKIAGEKYYFTGEPCSNGHLEPRLVSNKKCVKCYEEWYQANKEKRKAKQKEHYENNKDQYVQNARRWEGANENRAKEIDREWHRKQRAKKKQEPEG